MHLLTLLVSLLFSTSLFAQQVPAGPAASAPTVEQRLQRMERLLDSRGLLELFTKVEQLQGEVRELRGMIEMQSHRHEELSGRLRNLYSDIDRRLRALEVSGVAPPATAGAAAGEESAGSRQPPATVQSRADEPTDARKVDGAAADAPVPSATATAPKATPAPVTAEERAAYERAIGYLREGRYGDATTAFREFLAASPNSSYSDNAQYWLGEASFVTRNFEQAMTEFSQVIKLYPGSPKVADALLKIGFVHYERGEWADARARLSEVVGRYPRSTAARLAEQRLQKMSGEGR